MNKYRHRISVRLSALLAAGLLSVSLLGCSTQMTMLSNSNKWNSRFADFSLSPDGKTIVFTGAGDGGSDLYLLDLKTSRVHALTHSPENEGSPTFSADGKQIVYASSADTISPSSHLFICSLDGTHHRQLTHEEGVFDTMASFSPEGKQIVFARATLHRPYSFGGMVWDHYDIYIMDKDGSHLRRLTNKQYYQAVSPKMAPQRQTVIYQADHEIGGPGSLATDVFQVDASHPLEPLALTRSGRGCGPVFSPSGSRIYYLSYLDTTGNFDYEVWGMDSDGMHPRQITYAHSLLQRIAVSSDDEHLFVLSDKTRTGTYDLEEVTLSDGHLRQIADSSLFDDPLHWKPSTSE